MKFNKYFLTILILIKLILKLNANIPCTNTKLHINKTNPNLIGITISKDNRFVLGVSTEEWLHVWDLYKGNNAVLNLDITFDDQYTNLDNIVTSDTFDDGTILFAIKTTCYLDENNELVTSKIRIIQYNFITKEVISDFYNYQCPNEILDMNIQDNTLNIVTTKGSLIQINLTTHKEEVTNLFENLPDAIGYKVQFCQDKILIIANKYHSPFKPHTISFYHNNKLISRRNIPCKCKFQGMFSNGSLFLQGQITSHSQNSDFFHVATLFVTNATAINCNIETGDIACIEYQQNDHTFVKLINNHTRKHISIEIPATHECLVTSLTDDGRSLKLILGDSNSTLFVLEISLFNVLSYIKNHELQQSRKGTEMLTGDYKITYNPKNKVFEINKASEEIEADVQPTTPLYAQSF